MTNVRERLELLADDINRKYFPERLSSPLPLDPYDFLEAIGCEIEWKYISPDDSILGMTFFRDGYWYIWEGGVCLGANSCKAETFREGTVVINQRLLDSTLKKASNIERFVVVHEGAHWLKDRDYFSKKEESVVNTCFKNNFFGTHWDRSMSELEIIERQTNYLAAAILMPRDVIRQEFFRAGRYKNIPEGPIEYKSYMKAWIAKLSKNFGVNFNPVKYRLKDLHIISE